MDTQFIVISIFLYGAIFATVFLLYWLTVKHAASEEAMVIYGRGEGGVDNGEQVRVVVAGRTFVWPIVERMERLSLTPMDVRIEDEEVQLANGRYATVSLAMQAKVPNDKAQILLAAEHFLSKDETAVQRSVSTLVEAELYHTMAQVDEEMMGKRTAVSTRLEAAIGKKLAEVGMQPVSFLLKKLR